MTEKEIKEILLGLANRLDCKRPEADEPGTYLSKSDCRDDFVEDLEFLVELIKTK